MKKGYENTTVADIVAAAGVSRDVFYEHFTDKHNAFLEAQQHPTQHILDTCAAAYFSVEDWPERIWRAFSALIEMVVATPDLAPAPGRVLRGGTRRDPPRRGDHEVVHDLPRGGLRYRPEARELPHLCSQAIAGAIFEIIQRHVARGDGAGLAGGCPSSPTSRSRPSWAPRHAIARISRAQSALCGKNERSSSSIASPCALRQAAECRKMALLFSSISIARLAERGQPYARQHLER